MQAKILFSKIFKVRVMVFNATFNNILTTDENVEYQNK
jgi:hypothetical protein